MDKTLKLSIVIPAYNEEGYITACLYSIAQQTQKPDEVIVVDNNSTDKTVAEVSMFKFARIIKEKKQGAVAARNRGFNAARGDIIARIDADSMLPPDWVNNVKRIFTDQSISAATGPARGYDLPFPSASWLPHHLLCLILLLPPRHPFLFGFNMALRRSAWLKVKSIVCGDKFMHEDLDLAIHLRRSGYRIAYSRKLLLGASGRRYSNNFKSFYYYMKTYVRTYRRHDINDWLVYFAVAVYYLGYFFYRPWTYRRPPRQNPMGP